MLYVDNLLNNANDAVFEKLDDAMVPNIIDAVPAYELEILCVENKLWVDVYAISAICDVDALNALVMLPVPDKNEDVSTNIKLLFESNTKTVFGCTINGYSSNPPEVDFLCIKISLAFWYRFINYENWEMAVRFHVPLL